MNLDMEARSFALANTSTPTLSAHAHNCGTPQPIAEPEGNKTEELPVSKEESAEAPEVVMPPSAANQDFLARRRAIFHHFHPIPPLPLSHPLLPTIAAIKRVLGEKVSFVNLAPRSPEVAQITKVAAVSVEL
jgi:hypothetical protein